MTLGESGTSDPRARVTEAVWERVGGCAGGTVGGLATAGSVVFAATSVGIYRSEDGGQTWTLTGSQSTLPLAEVVAPSEHFEHDQTLFACAGEGLYRSTDGGNVWQPVLVGSRMLSVATSLTEERLVLAATETDGVVRSEDGGHTWTAANAGLLDHTAMALALSPHFKSDRTGFAGTASGLYRTRNGARSWRALETDPHETAVQCIAVSPIFRQDRLVLAGTEADGLLRSDDAGATWRRPASLGNQGVTALAFSSRYPTTSTIAAAIENGIALSDDAGQTWRRIGAPEGAVLGLVFLATGDGEVLLAGLHRHGIARSKDDGASWELSNAGLNGRLLTGLVLSPAFAHDRTLFVFGPQDGVSMSEDGGRTWAERNAGLADQAVRALAISPAYAQDRTLYAETEAGVHVSHDGATTWLYSPGLEAPATTGTTPSQTYQPWSEGPAVVALAICPTYSDDRAVYALAVGGTIWRRRDSDSDSDSDSD